MIKKEKYLDAIVPETIGYLAEFLTNVIEGIENDLPERTNVRIEEKSDPFADTIFYGFDITSKESETGIWIGIFIDHWKMKGLPICIQLCHEQDDYPASVIEKFESFSKEEKKALTGFSKNFQDFATVAIKNELIETKSEEKVIKIVLGLMKRLHLV